MTYEEARYELCMSDAGYLPSEVDDMDPDHFQSLLSAGKAFTYEQEDEEVGTGIFTVTTIEDWDRAMAWREKYLERKRQQKEAVERAAARRAMRKRMRR